MFLLFTKLKEEGGGGGWGAFSRGALVRRYDLIGGYLFGGGFGAFYGVGAYLPSF